MLIGLTLILSILSAIVSRGAGLAILLFSVVILPEFSRFDWGIIQMSTGRIIAIILFLKWKSSTKLEINTYDRVVIFYWLFSIFAMIISGSNSAELIRTIGRSLDTVLMYFVTRVCLNSINSLRVFFYLSKIAIIPASILSIRESLTATSIYTELRYANTWVWVLHDYEVRLLGMVRSYGSTLHPIYWGMTLSATLMLRQISGAIEKNRFFDFVFIIGVVGVLTSLSSGPIGMLFIFCLLALLVKTKGIFKKLFIFTIISVIFIEIISNRHFYDLVQYFSLNGATAWYRSKLISVAISHIKDYIFLGVGGNWPHHWGREIDGRAILDVVNQYIMVALYGGGALVFAFVYIILKPIQAFYRSWSSNLNNLNNARRLFSFALIAIFLAGFSVAFYNPFEIILYILLGFGRQLEVLNISQSKGTHNFAI